VSFRIDSVGLFLSLLPVKVLPSKTIGELTSLQQYQRCLHLMMRIINWSIQILFHQGSGKSEIIFQTLKIVHAKQDKLILIKRSLINDKLSLILKVSRVFLHTNGIKCFIKTTSWTKNNCIYETQNFCWSPSWSNEKISDLLVSYYGSNFSTKWFFNKD